MISRLSLLFLALAGIARAADPADAPRLGAIPADYKHAATVPSTFFNPFKIQGATESDAGHRDAAAVSDQSIIAAIGHRGVSGLLYAASAGQDRAIIGDEVFAVGDELQFADDQQGSAPLISNAAVILRGVANDKLTFDVTPVGETTRRLTYPLHAFWKP